ncbi:hypothetical protein Sjap_015818 [Stephania japonica]|uniref:alpha-amylase n=1 Tax=Stephania japonica TaxID=461633 RepID=A0AAP0IJU3_9MAGN
MSATAIHHHHHHHQNAPKFHPQLRKSKPHHHRLNCSRRTFFINGAGGCFCSFKSPVLAITAATATAAAAAASTDAAALAEEVSEAEASEGEVLHTETIALKRTRRVDGKVSVRLGRGGQGEDEWQLTVGCDLPGKWILHWGVTYPGDISSDWDQPPPEMRPAGTVPVKDYAVETPFKITTLSEGQEAHEVQIGFSCSCSVAAINFVLKDEETGSWVQHRGRDFKVPLKDYVHEDTNIVGAKKGFSLWPGAFGQLSAMLLKAEGSTPEGEENVGGSKVPKQIRKRLEGFYEECSVFKETSVENTLSVHVKGSSVKKIFFVNLETDLPGDVVVHWGACRDNEKRWEIPDSPHPPQTKIFKKKALQTLLQLSFDPPLLFVFVFVKPKENGQGSWGLFSLDKEFVGFLFVLKLSGNSWLNCSGSDFYIPLSGGSPGTSRYESSLIARSEKTEGKQVVAYTHGILDEIKNLVGGLSPEKSRKGKLKEANENVFREIEKLAAEAYRIFRNSSTAFLEESISDTGPSKPPVKVCSGTGSGYEILCQGFNWESHKSGKWYMELDEKAAELAALGFSVVWLPPPTESVSPEGYMPKDLYNLNSRLKAVTLIILSGEKFLRNGNLLLVYVLTYKVHEDIMYGNVEELKILVKKFHEVGIKVLGDAVINHRCAHYQNQNGIWNIFGGQLNWDDRAVVADDPHFQGRGNKSSGDNFHAAPNIDHSQEFVRKDLKEWLCWLRKEIGYDGWRLDFVRGFWGGYVKDYLDASEPYFAVGEYWDSLSYTYGEMDHNQDAHRQRIIDWINATNGTAGAFDVTTKGILHSALERCEYWRLSDSKGNPPGVVGWWPSRAVTFIENHDTGSTQGHWRFPGGKEMQGYAYILTHPGTPTVFYDHIFSHYRGEISALISLRRRNKINCRSNVQINKAERDVYAATIDEKVAMKIGSGYYEPPNKHGKWTLVLEGRDYKINQLRVRVEKLWTSLFFRGEAGGRESEARQEARNHYQKQKNDIGRARFPFLERISVMERIIDLNEPMEGLIDLDSDHEDNLHCGSVEAEVDVSAEAEVEGSAEAEVVGSWWGVSSAMAPAMAESGEGEGVVSLASSSWGWEPTPTMNKKEKTVNNGTELSVPLRKKVLNSAGSARLS